MKRARGKFESSVVLDGTKTTPAVSAFLAWFESSVVLDGTKTKLLSSII